MHGGFTIIPYMDPPKASPPPCSLLLCRAAGNHPTWRRDRGAACDLVALANSCLVHIYALIPCLCWIALSRPCRKGSIKQGEGHRGWSLLWDRNPVAPSSLPLSAWFHGLACPGGTQACRAQTSPDTKLQSAVGRTDPAAPE